MKKDSLALLIAVIGIILMLIIIGAGLYFQYK